MEQLTQLLKLIDRPAFCVAHGQITAANDAARNRQLTPGTMLEPLLASGAEEYREFREGCLSLHLRCFGADYAATVTVLEGRHIFTLDPTDAEEELRLLGLTAQELREPLGNAMALLDELEGCEETAAKISRSLHQLLRIVGNMSAHPPVRFELIDVTAEMAEFWDKTRMVCDARGVEFTFSPVARCVCTYADCDLLVRAVHNLLSNGLKFTGPGGSIHLSVSAHGSSYRISMYSSGAPVGPMHNPFTRFRREPGLEDGRSGLGLGLRIVQTAALCHGGAVLMDTPAIGGVRVTMSMPIRQNSTGLRSSRYRISYSGNRDPMLIELSDVLPPEFYRK